MTIKERETIKRLREEMAFVIEQNTKLKIMFRDIVRLEKRLNELKKSQFLVIEGGSK